MKKKKKTRSRISNRSRKVHTLTKKIDKIYQKINKGSEKQVQERIKNLQEELILLDKQKRKKTKKTKKTKWKNKKRIRAGADTGTWTTAESCTEKEWKVTRVEKEDNQVTLGDDLAESGDDSIRPGQKLKLKDDGGTECAAAANPNKELTVKSVNVDDKVITFDDKPEADVNDPDKCIIKREQHDPPEAPGDDEDTSDVGKMALIGLAGAAVGVGLGVWGASKYKKGKEKEKYEEKIMLLNEKADEAYNHIPKKLKLAIVRKHRAVSLMEDSEGNPNVSDDFYDKHYQKLENELDEWSKEHKEELRAGLNKNKKQKKRRSGAQLRKKKKKGNQSNK
tara:strand:+ start:153 stop:1160 length:1008 start_codon:yes stop_codon:yes gene_type:complete